MCRNIQRCGFCAGANHVTNDCIKKEDNTQHQCTVCSSRDAKHTAWHRECPARKAQVEAAKIAYNTRPNLFQERPNRTSITSNIPLPVHKQIQIPITGQYIPGTIVPNPTQDIQEGIAPEAEMTFPPTAPEPAQRPRNPLNRNPKIAIEPTESQRSTGSWRIVKKKKGRPLGTTKASRNTKDIREYRNPLSNTQ
jgi:hypothetical protein